MKKTTYLMLVAMVAGLIAILGVTTTLMRKHVISISDYTIGGKKVGISLEPVSKVTFVDSKSGPINIDNYKGIAVLESDTARTTTLHTKADWLPFLDCKSDSGALTVTVDYKAIYKEYVDSSMSPAFVRLRSEDFVIATVIMPRGQLREVAARNKTVYLDSVRADEILSEVDYRLVLNNCHIKTFNSRSKKIDELKLEDSTIGKVNFKAVSNNFRVTCTSDASVIDDMYIDGVYHDPKKAFFKFEKANIRNFKFNPKNDKIVLNVNMKKVAW